MHKRSRYLPGVLSTVIEKAGYANKRLLTWLLIDIIYIFVIMLFIGKGICLSRPDFFIAHFSGIIIGTIVMFTGIGGGVLWIPILTFYKINPSEAVTISIFTQIAGKGMGSLNYLLSGMVDLKVARNFIPFALLGVFMGYVSGFVISIEYEKMLLYIFVLVASYLLIKMVQSFNGEPNLDSELIDTDAMAKSYPVVILSSFFTGLLSIGNTDWLIPHLERKLKMSTSRSVATGLFIMFITSLFFLFMTLISVWLEFRPWPNAGSILFATCSGVMLGGQFGTRLVRYQWFRERQKYAFALLLAMSIIHLLW